MATGANSSSSSTTSTSHTLTNLPAATANFMADNTLSLPISTMADSLLFTALQPAKRFEFIQPGQDLFGSAISDVKRLLDSYASQIADEQAEIIKEYRKRKRDDLNHVSILKVRKVHTEGFGVDQVWEQAKRVIKALTDDVKRKVEEASSEASDGDDGLLKPVRIGADGFEAESGDESLVEEDEAALQGMDIDHDVAGSDIDGGDLDDTLEDLKDDYDEEEDEEDEEVYSNGGEEVGGIFEADKHGLNDGFFSIDDFNKQTEFLEQADARAELNTGEASDEEDIDWDANPLSGPAQKHVSSRARASDEEKEENDNDDDEDGPTFGNADLDAPEGDSDDEDHLDVEEDFNGLGDNTNEVLYKDFFEPPPRRAGKGELQADYLQRQAKKLGAEPVDEQRDMERAINNVRRDLFDDESAAEDSEDALSEVDAGDPKSRRSAHERRQHRLAEEIRKLEAASVAKREWTLAGEARAADRPLNSLLEEDLDFERAGKPVPVITAEVTESIEELIKRRILLQEFDEVIRRRPDSESVPGSTRRGQFELDDSKPAQSLAEMYEEEHVKNTDPDAYISQADEKLRKQHDEIEGLWKDVNAKLDALSSWHYKPKPAAPGLSVVADVATIHMEDAQPTTAGGVAGSESMLAPQEIYRAEKKKAAIGEVIAGGAPISRQEMSREEKLRRRRREKERIQKRGGEEQNNRPAGKKARDRKDTVVELKRAGVKVIGNKGDVRDVEGNKIKAITSVNTAGSFKL